MSQRDHDGKSIQMPIHMIHGINIRQQYLGSKNERESRNVDEENELTSLCEHNGIQDVHEIQNNHVVPQMTLKSGHF